MEERQLFDEVVTLVVGGYKTLAVAHLWVFYLLATNPDAAARVRDELATVSSDRAPVPEDLPRLVRTRALVQEAMRLYPPIWGIFRVAAHDVEIAGAKVRRGATLFISPYTLHRNPKYWPSPTTFDPDNFRSGIDRPATAWLPFGAGRHKCIGTHYALAAVALSVATLGRRFTFDPPEKPIGVTTRSFTSPKGGMRLRLREIGPRR
jgi:cytochrome P450